MRRDALIAHITRHGAKLHKSLSRSEVYATSPLHMAGVPRRADIGVDNVIGICRALDVPVPVAVRQRRGSAKVLKKSQMTISAPADAMIVIIPREAVRTGKRGGRGRSRKRNSRG